MPNSHPIHPISATLVDRVQAAHDAFGKLSAETVQALLDCAAAENAAVVVGVDLTQPPTHWDSGVLRQLVSLLGCDVDGVRMAAWQTTDAYLVAVGGKIASEIRTILVDAALARLADAVRDVRFRALKVVLNEYPGTVVPPSLGPHLASLFADFPNFQPLQSVLVQFGQIQPLVDRELERLTSEDVDDRFFAVDSLIWMSGENQSVWNTDLVDALSRAIFDPDPEVAEAAEHGLSMELSKPKRASQSVVDRIAERARSVGLSAALEQRLGGLAVDDPRWAPALKGTTD